ncbi:MAG: hypothetical protein DSZ31_04005 [Gammaproteobacteria bacterium]|nr:MAG: hypothetical protein DSZ31_04005 [Gammaproteobacteria bacterium]
MGLKIKLKLLMHRRLFLLLLSVSLTYANLLYLDAEKVKKEGKVFIAEGNANLTFGKYFLKARRVKYIKNQEELIAEGDVFLTDKKDIFLHAKRVVYYLKTKVVELYWVEGKVKEGYFKSDFVKLRGDLYIFRDFCASKCGDYQAELCAKKFIFNSTQGKGTAYNALLKVEKVPIFYTPYYVFLTKRKSGFLTPLVGIDSYGGFIYRQPYFWAIDPYSDLTITADYRSAGMKGIGFQFRKYFSNDFYLESLNQYYYDSSEYSRWWEGRDYYRKNRFLLYGWGYKGKLQFGWDLPSDIDYYYDVFFFDKDSRYKSFAKSYLNYSVKDPKFTLNLSGKYFYNLSTRNRSADLLIFPDVYFYLKPIRLGKEFSLDLTSEVTNFYQYNKNLFRWRIEPKLKWRHIFGKTPVTFYFKPYYVYYSSGRYGNKKHIGGFDLKLKSLLYDYDLVRTSVWKLFSSFEWVYEFSPFEEKNTPNYDYFDQFSKKNTVTLRNLNTIYYKGVSVGEIILEQPYNFYNGYNFPTDGKWVSGKILPLKVYYEFNTPSRDISFSGKLYYDYQLSKVVYTSNSFSWKAVKTLLTEVNLKISHSLSKDHLGKRQSEGISYGLSARVRRLYAEIENYYDYLVSKNVRTSLDLSYRKKCWSLGIKYERDYDRDSGKYEWRVMIVFTVFSNPFNFLLTGGRQ